MIQKAKTKHLDSIMACYKATIQQMHKLNIFQWDDSYPTLSIIEEDIKKEDFFVYVEDNEVLACICINTEQHPTYSDVKWTFDGDVLVVHRLAIHPKSQGKGLAKQMMQFVENQVQILNYDGIRLDTFIENPLAINLYNKIGYNQLETVSFKNRTYHCFDKKIKQK